MITLNEDKLGNTCKHPQESCWSPRNPQKFIPVPFPKTIIKALSFSSSDILKTVTALIHLIVQNDILILSIDYSAICTWAHRGNVNSCGRNSMTTSVNSLCSSWTGKDGDTGAVEKHCRILDLKTELQAEKMSVYFTQQLVLLRQNVRKGFFLGFWPRNPFAGSLMRRSQG